MQKVYNSFKIIFIAAPLFIFCQNVFAADLTVMPAVINEKAKPRDILAGNITLKNETERKLNVYVVVFNLFKTGEEIYAGPQSGDKTASLGHWLEISRGAISLPAGEQKEIPYKIEVNLWAKPGNYNAVVYFASGNTRAEAEKNLASAGRLTINLEVFEEIKELLQIKKFGPEKTFFEKPPILFSLTLENIGNRPLAPAGEIRIYNRRGEEVDAIKINEAGEIIETNQIKEWEIFWKPNRIFGRYKAYLDLKYGSNQIQSLQDAAFFWAAPWKKMLGFFSLSAVFIAVLILIAHKIHGKKHRKKIPASDSIKK